MIKFPLLTMLLFIGATVFAQTQTEKEIKDLLATKWKLTHMEMNGQKAPVPPELGDSFLDFKPDGSIIKTDMSGDQKGKWTYDHTTKVITTTDAEGEEKFEIVKISATELVINFSEEGAKITLTLKKV